MIVRRLEIWLVFDLSDVLNVALIKKLFEKNSKTKNILSYCIFNGGNSNNY